MKNKILVWQLLEVYNKKVFLRDEALRSISKAALTGKNPSQDQMDRLSELEKWIQAFEQSAMTIDFDIDF
ncbi:hypothetical protein D3C71_1909260 [compost metagenome]